MPLGGLSLAEDVFGDGVSSLSPRRGVAWRDRLGVCIAMSLSLGISAAHFVVPSATVGPDVIGLSVIAAALELLGVPRGKVAGDDLIVAEGEVS